MVIGAAIGLYRAARVPMTGMPELIALFHSFVGLAAVLVGWNGYLEVEAGDNSGGGGGVDPALLGIHHAEVVIGVFIGAVTFTGSIVAWGKLSARFKSAPLVLPGKNFLNLGALVAFAALTVWFVIAPTLGVLIGVTVIALLLGVHLVASIGGGDADHAPATAAAAAGGKPAAPVARPIPGAWPPPPLCNRPRPASPRSRRSAGSSAAFLHRDPPLADGVRPKPDPRLPGSPA